MGGVFQRMNTAQCSLICQNVVKHYGVESSLAQVAPKTTIGGVDTGAYIVMNVAEKLAAHGLHL